MKKAVRASDSFFFIKMIWLTELFKKVVLIFLFTISFESCYPQDKQHKNEKSEKKLQISFVGDLMCHSAIIQSAKVSKDSFNFNPMFRFVKEELISSDLLVGNLETVVWEKYMPSGYPRFNAPIEYLEALKENGFDILAAANNHITDYWKEGLIATLQNIKKNKMEYIGVAATEEESDSQKIFYKNGISVSVLNYSYDINIKNLKKSQKFHVNFIDSVRIKNDIARLKHKNVDFIIVFYHFGSEYKISPNQEQVNLVNQTFKYGADIVIGSHPHVLQPVRINKCEDGNSIKNVVCYSLGNFLSNMSLRYTDSGAIINFYLSKYDNKRSIDSINYVATCVLKSKENEFLIIPTFFAGDYKKFDFINEADRIKMKNSFNDVKEILNKYNLVKEKNEIQYEK
jgi:poly-gamma-glutamate synthesis protein (capsule biosynthesis protein)